MGDVIKFPGKTINDKKNINFFVEKLPSHQEYAAKGQTRFTCATCDHVTKISFSGMVFRTCTFYCGNCGVGYTMTNPIFNNKGVRKNK